MTHTTSIHVRVNRNAAAVHVAQQDDATGEIRFPSCGAPGNTPRAYRAWRPVVVSDPVTCKRCARIHADAPAPAGPSHDPAACSVTGCTMPEAGK